MTTANPYIRSLIAYKAGKPIEETARELGMDPASIIKLASNENPIGPSPKAVQAMQDTLTRTHIYPDGGAHDLRERLADFHGVQLEQIVTGAGSSELITLLCMIYLNDDTNAVAAERSFMMYKVAAQSFNAGYVAVPNKPDWSHDLSAMLRAITPETRIVFIANPTNPIGTMVGQQEIDAFMEAVPDHVLVVFDEAYIDFADEQPDTIKYVEQGRRVAVLRTFSKAYGLAGMRVGYAITRTDVADLLHRVRCAFNVSVPAQAAARAAINDTAHLARTVETVRQGRRQFYEALDARGIPYVPTQTNFILVKVGNGRACFNKCLSKGVILRPMDEYGLPEHVRITIGTPEQNERCLRALLED